MNHVTDNVPNMPTVMEKLKIMGGPPPRAASSSPLTATSKANRPLQSMLSLERSYRLLLGGERLTTDYGGVAPTPATRRLDCLQRVRQANFGISTMDSREDEAADENNPHFVLCGLSVGNNGLKPASTEHYLSENRVGRYKTSAREIYKARRNAKGMKPLCEPGPHKPETRVEVSDNNVNDEISLSIPSILPTPTPSTSTVSKKTARSSLELTGRKLCGATSSMDVWDPYDIDDIATAKTPKRSFRMTRREFTSEQLDSAREQQAKGLKDCLQVHPSKSTTETDIKALLSARNPPQKEKRINYINPYKDVKQRERKYLPRNNNDRRYEFTSVQSYIDFNRAYHQQSDKHFRLPKSILRVPNPCSDTFLLQMMSEMNKPRSKTFTNLYADSHAQRDWDEPQISGRAATSHGKLAISTYQVPFPMVRGASTNMDEFLDYYYWSESDVKDDTDKESDKE